MSRSWKIYDFLLGIRVKKGEENKMHLLNFLVLFLQEGRTFFGFVYGEQPRLLVFAVLGLQFLILVIDVSFNNSSLNMPKIALTLMLFIPLYLFNKLALHTVFIVLNIINLRRLTLKKVVQYALIIHIFFFVILFALLAKGAVYDATWPMLKGTAHTLGFQNPNSTSRFLTELVLILSFYLLLCKKSLFLNLMLLIPGYFIYRLTYGRTYFFALVLYYFFLIIFKCRFFYKHNYWVYKIAPIMLGAALIVGIHLYETNPWLDLLFSMRLSYSKAVLDGFSHINYIFGSSYVPEGLTVDCSYLFILCEAGIFSVLLFWILYSSFVKKISFEEAKSFFPFVFYTLIAGVTEITFPAFSAFTAIFYKILYQIASKKNNIEVLI